MNKIVIPFLAFLSVFAATAFAQTSIKAEVDKTSLTTDQTLTYKLVITTLEKNVPTPQLPKFTGFNAILSEQSSEVRFSKGNVKTTVIYFFVLAPATTGSITIEPATIEVNKETLSGDGFLIDVKQGKARPHAPPEKKPPLPEERGSEEPQVTI